MEKVGSGVIVLIVLHTSFTSVPIVFGCSEEKFQSRVEEE